MAAAGATTKAVTPATLASAFSAAVPGDVLLLGAGSYPSFTISRGESAGQPIVIRGESTDTVTIGGRVTMSDRQWVHLENVTAQGEVRMHGASNMVVRGCKIRTTSNGINFQISDTIPRNNYIVDNDVTGGATWVDDQLGADGYDGGEGIQFTGAGHVICWNHVQGFRDNISHMEYDEAYEQISIDICNNDIEEATDDGIDADSAMGNVRVMRNRIRNCFVGCSSQPTLGGPTYYVRNVMYNVLYSPFKFPNGTVGDVLLHNTVVKCGDGWGSYAGATRSRAYVRNNLFIGGTRFTSEATMRANTSEAHGIAVAATVCDRQGKCLYMNEHAARGFAKAGGRELVGRNLLDCHPEPARQRLAAQLTSPSPNTYTIGKHGVRKLIHQIPWFADGEFAGVVELSLELPATVPHLVRES